MTNIINCILEMSSDNLENMSSVSQVCNSIPDITAELVEASNNQDIAIRKKELEIREVKNNTDKEEVKCCQLESELASLNRKIYCAVEDTKELESKSLCEKENLNKILMESLQLKSKIKHCVQNVIERKQQYTTYKEKMRNYDYNILNSLESTIEFVKLSELKTKLEDINQQIKTKEGFKYGSQIETVDRELEKLTSEKEGLISKQAVLTTQLAEIKNNIDNIEKEKEIYLKRNKAQLKRLQKQLQELDNYRKKKHEEVEELEQRIQAEQGNR